jgi:hypothetical protein
MNKIDEKIIDLLDTLKVKYTFEPEKFVDGEKRYGMIIGYDLIEQIKTQIACYVELTDHVYFSNDKVNELNEDHNFVMLHELTHWTGSRSRLDRLFVARRNNEMKKTKEEKITLGRLRNYFGSDDPETILEYFLPILNKEFPLGKSVKEIVASTEGYENDEESENENE